MQELETAWNLPRPSRDQFAITRKIRVLCCSSKIYMGDCGHTEGPMHQIFFFFFSNHACIRYSNTQTQNSKRKAVCLQKTLTQHFGIGWNLPVSCCGTYVLQVTSHKILQCTECEIHENPKCMVSMDRCMSQKAAITNYGCVTDASHS